MYFRWIECEQCMEWFHLQCSVIDYSTEDYYDIDIIAIEFRCACLFKCNLYFRCET